MIEINLLPGAARRTKGRGTGMSMGAVLAGVRSKVKDPFMLAAVASFLVSAGAIGALHFSQTGRASDLESRTEKAVKDSVRYASVLRERHRAEAKRDSVLKQLKVIRSIDDDRFVWPHIMDEVSRALPPYTWLKSLAVAAPAATNAQAPAAAAAKPKDPTPSDEPIRFHIVGNTVDIQALTRFMKMLEASPFIQNVQLARSDLAVVDGKEVTEFQLDAQYEHPDKSAVNTAPVSLSVK